VLELYQDFKKHLNVCITTLKGSYGTYHNHLKKMEDSCGYQLTQQLEIKTWIQSNAGLRTALNMLSMFHRMIEWGKREERLPHTFVSKFGNYHSEFKKSLKTVNTRRKPPKSVDDLVTPEGIQAWSEEERDIIISAFYERKIQNSKIDKTDYMAPLIDFLFNVGCRHGEAFALTWSDISSDFTSVYISESYSSPYHIIKCTKTGKIRLAP
jgi:integrase